MLLAGAGLQTEPDAYAPPPPAHTPARLAWDALTGRRGADAAIERWLALHPRAPTAQRFMLAHRLCQDYTRTIVGPPLVAACEKDWRLDPRHDRGSYDTALILQDAPRIKVTGAATVAMTFSPSMGSRAIPASVNGITLPWIVDVGASMSLMTESTAKRLGVRMFRGTIGAETATSIRIKGRIGMLDRLTIGDATIEHLPVYVVPDAVLTFDEKAVPAILGLPVLAAFGRAAWLDNGRRLALGAIAPTPSGRTMKLYWHPDGIGLPVTLAGGTIGAQFDSGAGSTTLYLPGLALLSPDQMATAVERDVPVSGAGGIETSRLATLGRLTLCIGGLPIVVDRPNVEKRTDLGAGRLGNDMIDQLQTFTMDFTTMTLSIAPKRRSSAPSDAP